LSRAELLSLLAARDQAAAERDRVIAQLRAEVAELAVRLARLERLISRNSGNSSFPPSMDDQPGRLRSEATTRHRYAIRGCISTAAKHGRTS
jgi:transposase